MSVTMSGSRGGVAAAPNGTGAHAEKKVASAKEKSIQWGSRSVDIFEKKEQIGEGTYGYITTTPSYCIVNKVSNHNTLDITRSKYVIQAGLSSTQQGQWRDCCFEESSHGQREGGGK